MNIVEHSFYEYVKNKRGEKIGVIVVAKLTDGDVSIGWSKVKKNSSDVFDKELGLDIAYGRAISKSNVGYPFSFQEIMNKMVSRAIRYYKTDSIYLPPMQMQHIQDRAF